MTPLWIQVGTFIVLFLTLVAAVWYAWEARKQAEAQLKPCITFKTMARDAVEAVLGMGGISGETVLAFDEGRVNIMNIGNGPAINIWYKMEPVNPPPDSNLGCYKSYLHAIQPKDKASLPIARGVLQQHEFQFEIAYESLSGRQYRTKMTVHDLVLTEFSFK